MASDRTYDKFIRAHYKTMARNRMANQIGKSNTFVSNRMKQLGLKVTARDVKKFRSQALRNRGNTEFDKIIKRDYLKYPIKTLAERIGKSDTFIKTRLMRLGLKIPKRLIEQRKKSAQFKPGSIPANKGKKTPAHIKRKYAHTMFKKGHTPANVCKNGDITLRHPHKDRNAKPYYWVRIRKGKWKMLHVKLWEDKHGKIPKGHTVVFKDRNSLNCKISNLKLLTRQQLMQWNTIQRYPTEIKQVMRLMGKLRRTIENKTKPRL